MFLATLESSSRPSSLSRYDNHSTATVTPVACVVRTLLLADPRLLLQRLRWRIFTLNKRFNIWNVSPVCELCIWSPWILEIYQDVFRANILLSKKASYGLASVSTGFVWLVMPAVTCSTLLNEPLLFAVSSPMCNNTCVCFIGNIILRRKNVLHRVRYIFLGRASLVREMSGNFGEPAVFIY